MPRTAGPLSLPVLAWALPAGIAGRLRAETGQPFAGQAPGRLDFAILVSRARQRRAAADTWKASDRARK